MSMKSNIKTKVQLARKKREAAELSKTYIKNQDARKFRTRKIIGSLKSRIDVKQVREKSIKVKKSTS